MVAKKGVTLLIYFLVVLVTLQIISATDVGFITKTNPNAEVMQVFSDMGLTVEVIKDQDVLRKNLNDYRFLFIDDGILRNTKSIPVYNYRSIVMNRYYGDEFGLTDVDGISQIASNSPLQVKKGNQIQTVYTQAFENIGGGAAIPYYYLDDKNKANFTGVARTYIGGNNGFQFGDVVATANPGTRLVNGKKTGAKMCFFGISKSKYWTQNAKLLFEECTGFVASVCDNDLQCSDNNEYTVDICENPGTVHSECKHYPIECLSESDCGTDGFEGNNFCSGNSVKRNYINYTCNNPGTRTSSCSSVSEDKLIQQCSELCVEGACVDIECFNDAECNDNNQYTQDKCLNPGTITSVCDHTPIKCLNNLDCNDNNRTTEDICKNPGTIDSFCTNNKITCFVNTDCGTDGFVNQPLCSDGSVIQDYKTFKCNNPGTSQSSCTNTVTPTTKEVCANSCQNGECVVINCKKDSDCNDNNLFTKDTCKFPATPQSYCFYEDIECFNKGDCGVDGFIGGNYCSVEGDAVKDYKTFSCNNAGTPQSSCSNVVAPKVTDDCSASEMCSNGICETITCSRNSDCGINGYVGDSYCSTNGDIVRDFKNYKCNNAGTSQSYCSSNITINVQQECTGNQICVGRQQNKLLSSKGVVPLPDEPICVTIKCTTDSNCNDNNPRTVDKCVNPGTSESFCRNTPVNCLEDLDCGITGYTGNEYCSSDDIYKKFQTSTCLNPGTVNSYCNINTRDRLIQDCDDGNPTTIDSCSEVGGIARCNNERIICNRNSDCGSDGYIGNNYCSVNGDSVRDYKLYTCSNPGTPQSSCSNRVEQRLIDDCTANENCIGGQCVEKPPIICNRNSDCGSDGYIGNNYCSVNGDSVRDYKLYTCSNPGTPQSSCSNRVEQRLIDDCTANENCIGGQCVEKPPIRCSTNSDCNDNNLRTVDQCVKPGTPESFCRNTPVNCLEDLDCGVTGFVGNNFCYIEDIYKTYQTALCINGGTLESYCNLEASPKKVQECSDTNPNTIDSCAERNNEAICLHTPILCSKNSDCGSDGYIGNNYCSVNGDSVRDYKLYTCSNPGTPQSSCSNRVEQRLIDDCTSQEICTNGICDIPQECRELEDYGMKQGFYGEYFNYPRNHSDMNLPFEVLDNEVLGDPLSDLNNWDRDWYNDNNGYYRFSRIDSNLNFGENFFPFDGTRAEEIEPYWNHDYHFGAHWKGMVKVVEPGAYKFSLNSDDDTWVYIDGKLVINNGMVHTPDIKKVTSVNLEGGEIIDVFFAERHVARSHMNLEIESGVTIIPVKDECPLPDVDSVYQCPSGTEKIYVGSTNLIANNSTYAGTSKRNGYPLGPGRYIVEIKDGALSPWNNNVGNNGPIEDGWWVGKTWLSKVNIASFKNNKFENSKITTGYYSTKQEAVNSGKGLYKIINLDWKNGDKNLYLWLADESIDDNRGNVEVELYYCNKD